MPGKAYIGTSGWNYKSWRNSFYGEMPQKQWLRFCAERFTSIEVNGTFYRLQPQSTFENGGTKRQTDFGLPSKGIVTSPTIKADRRRRTADSLSRCRITTRQRLAAVVWQLPAAFKRTSSDWRNSCKRCGTGKVHGTRSSFATNVVR